MDQARRTQFAHLEDARRGLLEWASASAIPLVRVEFVVPFVATDYSTAVWLFYATDADVARSVTAGSITSVDDQFRSLLAAGNYPADWLAAVSFQVDSHENVERNFAGSYFHRLR